MLKIWGRTDSPNVQKVMWCVHELGLPYERIDAGHEFGLVKEPWYLAMNPNGLIPTIDDDGFVLWESNAIVRYLCGRHSAGNLSPTEARGFADADRWMSWQGSTLGPVMRRIVFEIIRTPAAQQDAGRVGALLAEAAKIWTILDRHMAGRAFVMGPRLTMADFVFGPHLRLWLTYPIARPELRHLAAWHDRIGARDAFIRSLKPPAGVHGQPAH
jgi:glutathione S-transferase